MRAETLVAGSALVETAGVVNPMWPLVGDGRYLPRSCPGPDCCQCAARRVAGKVVADANVSETAKVQKKIVRDCLIGEGRERAEG